MADTADKLNRYDFGNTCVCIGRASTETQNTTAQIKDLKKFAKDFGYTVEKTFFTSESGFLEYDLKQGWNLVTDYFDSHPNCRVLFCTEMSRLSRNDEILAHIKNYLKVHKIQLIIKDINFCLYNQLGVIPQGNEMVFSLYASLANSEMTQKKERFKRALTDYKELGYSIGGKRLFGYNRVHETKDGKKRSKYEKNDEEIEYIKTIYKWYAYGIDGDLSRTSIVTITRECIARGFPPYLHSKRNVNKCLKEGAYIGQKETHNRTKNPEYWNYHHYDKPKYKETNSYICTYPAIFEGEDRALFDKVQQRLKENNSKKNKGGHSDIDKSRAHTTILAKLIVCPKCGKFLHGEYRARKDYRRPHLGVHYSFSYRCSESRAAIHKCEFNHILSMPMMDSVVWAYCKNAAFSIINTENKTDINKRLSEIDDRIRNLKNELTSFNYDSRVRAEDAMLRTKMRSVLTPERESEILKDYEAHIKSIEKEYHSLENGIYDLEEEKKSIKNSVSFLDSINKHKTIANNKKLLYKYIHQIVDSISIVYCDQYHTVLKINLKHRGLNQIDDEFIYLYKKTTSKITPIVVNAYDPELRRKATEFVSNLSDVDGIVKDHVIKSVTGTKYTLSWDAEKDLFVIGDFSFSPQEMYQYAHNTIEKNIKEQNSLMGQPVQCRFLECERIRCYEEDKRIDNTV